MRLSIKKQFLLLFLLITILSLLLLYFALRTSIDSLFHDYKWTEQTKIFDHIVETLENHYATNGTWEQFNGNTLGKLAMNEGCYFTAYDNNGNLIWTSEHMISVNDQLSESNYWRNIFPLKLNNQTVGRVFIGQMTANIYTPKDIKFKKDVVFLIFMSIIFALLLALPFIMISSSKLSHPIKYLSHIANKMTKGDLITEIKVNSMIDEIRDLSNSLDTLRKSLLEQEILRKELASNISHELRTPLNILQNQLEALIDGVFEPTPEMLESLHSEIIRFTSLVGDLEKITKIESDAFIPVIQDVKLYEVCTNVCNQFQAAFQRKGIELKTEIRKGIIVKAEKDKLIQLIINIISNALKYTDSGTVLVRTNMYKQQYAYLEVIDTGPGLSDYDKEKIFERFYRTEKSRNRGTGGAGLGLAIVKKIIDAHGWNIEVISDGETGTTFKVKFT